MKELFLIKQIVHCVDKNTVNNIMEDCGVTEFDITKFDIGSAMLNSVNAMKIVAVCTSLSKAKSIVKKISDDSDMEFFTDRDTTSCTNVGIAFDEEEDMYIRNYEIIRIRPDKVFDDELEFLINKENMIDLCNILTEAVENMQEFDPNWKGPDIPVYKEGD